MKNKLLTLFFVVTFFLLSAPSASAVTNGVVKVGLRYGSSALASANLENAEGAGYEFGYYDGDRRFVSLGQTDVTTITMSPSGGSAVTVTRTGTSEVLYEHFARDYPLGVRPFGTITWFKGCRYAGGFEYVPESAGSLRVINVVDLEDYVKGVVPYEMPGDWPLEALEAQAVCARTFVQGHSKHLREYGFDVCNGVDCQVYNGHGSGGAGPSETSGRAVENTAGLCIYYNGTLVQDAVYHSSDGGATEDGANVWGTETGYLKGKADPYEQQLFRYLHRRGAELDFGSEGPLRRNGAGRVRFRVHAPGEREAGDLCGDQRDQDLHRRRLPDDLLQQHLSEVRQQHAF